MIFFEKSNIREYFKFRIWFDQSLYLYIYTLKLKKSASLKILWKQNKSST